MVVLTSVLAVIDSFLVQILAFISRVYFVFLTRQNRNMQLSWSANIKLPTNLTFSSHTGSIDFFSTTEGQFFPKRPMHSFNRSLLNYIEEKF